MALKHRLADASYWFYDRARHKSAFESAVQPGTASDFAGMKGHKYALLVTFRRDGTAVPTPVWFALLDDHRLVTSSEERTAKVRRIRRDPRTRVFPCDPAASHLDPVSRAQPGSWRMQATASGQKQLLTVSTGAHGASTRN